MEEIYIKPEISIEIEIKPEPPSATSFESVHMSFQEVPTENKPTTSKIPCEFDVKSEKETNEDTWQYPEPSFTSPLVENLEITGKVYENGKINRLSCNLCDKSFKNRANLKNHLKYVHSGNHTVECSQCFRTFKSHAHLRSHLDSVHAQPEEVNCHLCGKVFLNQKKLKNHLYYTHPQPNEQVTCNVCSKVYKSQYSLKIHMRQVHPEGQSVPCPYCDKVFKVDMLLQRHIKWSHPDDGMVYKCQQCFKVLPSLACYKKHISNTHDASSRATCELCRRIFKTKKSLDRHLKNVHNGDGKEVKEYVPSPYVCSYCERNFESKNSLFWHIQKYHHSDSQDVDSTSTHCEICDKSYSDNASLQRHYASIHSLETATCNICSKEFKSAVNLQSHIRITHAPPEAIQTCDICKKTFKCALHLRMHVSAVHTEGEFNCETCNKTFASVKYLNKHKKTHIETRDYPCEVCGKMYKTLFSANKHRRNVHGGVKCSFCHIKQPKIEEHMLKCPKKTILFNITEFCCFKCGQSFESETDLKQHDLSCELLPIDPIVKLEVERLS